MKKVIATILFSLVFNCTSKAQEWVDTNIIVTVNETLSPSSAILKMSYNSKDGTTKNINIRYSPGSLKIRRVEYEELVKDSVQNLKVQIRNTEICNDNIKYSHFEIDDFKIGWLQQDFFILHVYDIEVKRYKRIYDALPNKSFTYDYDSPSGSMRRVQKKKIRTNDCE